MASKCWWRCCALKIEEEDSDEDGAAKTLLLSGGSNSAAAAAAEQRGAAGAGTTPMRSAAAAAANHSYQQQQNPNDEDLKAIRLWRRRHCVSSANNNNNMTNVAESSSAEGSPRGDAEDDDSRDSNHNSDNDPNHGGAPPVMVGAPPVMVGTPPPSVVEVPMTEAGMVPLSPAAVTPVKNSARERIELSPMAALAWKERSQLEQQKQQYEEDDDERLEHTSGGFPTFTKEEEEWRQKLLLGDSYMSSSSSSTTEDKILRRSQQMAVVGSGEEEDERYNYGPIDLDDLMDDDCAISRPGTDVGENQPVAPHHLYSNSNPVEVSDLKFPSTAGGSSPMASSSFISSPSSNYSIEQEQQRIPHLDISTESEELDAIVAAIDQTRQEQQQQQQQQYGGSASTTARGLSTTTSRTPESSNGSSSVASRPTPSPPNENNNSTTQNHWRQSVMSAGASPSASVNSPNSTAQQQQQQQTTPLAAANNIAQQRLFPKSRRDSPSVHDPSAYGGGHVEETGGGADTVALITPSSYDSNESMPSRGMPVVRFGADQRRRDRSRSRGRMSPSVSSSSRNNSPRQLNNNTSIQSKQSSESSASSTHDRSPDAVDDDYDGDRLSDVPSDVDTAVKERYLRACRILKSSLIEKDEALQPSEKIFLASLLLDKAPSKESPTENRMNDVESAAGALRSNPVFVATRSEASSSAGPDNHSSNGGQARGLDDASLTPMSEDTLLVHNKQRLPEDELGEENRPRKSALSQTSSSLFSRVDEDYPFKILGTEGFKPTVLTPTVMEALRGFFPYAVSEENFFLKYALERDGAELMALLSKVRSCKHTIISVETVDGYVFGAFCSSPWSVQSSWFGSGESFLWRLKNPRIKNNNQTYDNDGDNEIEIYPYTGSDELIQYCTPRTIAIGGGTDWGDTKEGSPYEGEPSGIGFLVDGDLLGGETNSCVTFANPRLGDRSARATEFEIQALEVWTVTPCLTVEEAEQISMRRMFLEELSSTNQEIHR